MASRNSTTVIFFKRGEPINAPSSPAVMPVKKLSSTRARKSREVMPAARKPLCSSGVSWIFPSSVLPVYMPKRGATIFSETRAMTMVTRKVEAIMKYQLPVTSAVMPLSGIKPVMALLVMPAKVASVPEIITLAVKPAWAPA